MRRDSLRLKFLLGMLSLEDSALNQSLTFISHSPCLAQRGCETIVTLDGKWIVLPQISMAPGMFTDRYQELA
jgi:hypothetical protein